MKYIKHLSELNKLTVWYVTSVSGFMGWYVALFWEDYRYFCCSSQNNLMKGEIFLWSVSKIIDLKSLLKSPLSGKGAFDISSSNCPSLILSSFCFSFESELTTRSFQLMCNYQSWSIHLNKFRINLGHIRLRSVTIII